MTVKSKNGTRTDSECNIIYLELDRKQVSRTCLMSNSDMELSFNKGVDELDSETTFFRPNPTRLCRTVQMHMRVGETNGNETFI